MKHGPATKWQTEKSQSYKTKVGLIMFAAYTPIYLAFILICVLSPRFMARDVGSLNVATIYGFGIIVLAIVQAILYNYICSRKERQDNPAAADKGEAD